MVISLERKNDHTMSGHCTAKKDLFVLGSISKHVLGNFRQGFAPYRGLLGYG